MEEKIEAAKRYLGDRYILSKHYKPIQRHRPDHPVNTLQTIREVRARLQEALS